MPTDLPPAAGQEPLVRYGAGTRAFMLAAGMVFVLTFGFVGVFVLREVGTAKSAGAALGTTLLAALLLAPALYGLVLAWRGLSGCWRPRSWTRRLALGVGVVLAAASLAATPATIIRLFRTDHLSMLRGGLRSVGGLDWYFSLMILTAPLQLAAHELGHMFAGRWVGFEFLSIQVGPFCLDRPLRAWRVTWQPLAFGFGGRATMLFHGRHDLPRRTAIFAAGGPAANLLLAAFAGLASAAARPTTAIAALTVGILNACAVEGVLLCAYNLMPIRLAGNDGARILEALQPVWRGARERTVASSGSDDEATGRKRRSRAQLRLIDATRDSDEARSTEGDSGNVER
jgi:hypothetical protein